MVLLLANVWMLTHSNCHLLLPAHYLFSVLVWWSAGNVQETQAIFFSACSSFCQSAFCTFGTRTPPHASLASSPGMTEMVLSARSTLNVLKADTLPRSTNSVTYLQQAGRQAQEQTHTEGYDHTEQQRHRRREKWRKETERGEKQWRQLDRSERGKSGLPSQTQQLV